MDELTYQVAFASVRGMNVTLAAEIVRRCGSVAAFMDMPQEQLQRIMESRQTIYTDDYRRQKLQQAAAECEFVADNDVRPLFFTDSGYPQRLLQCEDAPAMLYTRGDTDLNRGRMLSIVGTRHATNYGINFTRQLVGELADGVDNLVIVSGLAYGIDVAAHRAALEAKVPTVAVMATGLSTVYPAEHRSVAMQMVRSGGMLMTEYRSRESVHKGNFVARNRIVAGMSEALLVVESAEKGGALITANLAHGYSRDVFALPGRHSDPYSSGCNRLIGAGVAQLVTSAAGIASAMRWPMRDAAAPPPSLPIPLNDTEEQIVAFLARTEQGADLSQISAHTGIGVGKLMSLLIDMEFRHLLLSLPGARYVLP